MTDLLTAPELDPGKDPWQRTAASPPPTAPAVPTAGLAPHDDAKPEVAPMRVAVVGAIAAGGAAAVSGGMFQGTLATIVGLVAAAGGALAVGAAIRARRTWLQYVTAPGIFVLGYVAALLLPNSTGVTGTVPSLVRQAIRNGGLGKPPIPFDPGWRFLMVALVGLVAAGGVSLACSLNRPRLAIAVPLPLMVAAALDQPAQRQLIGGIIAFASLLLALSVSRGAELAGEANLSRRTEMRQLGRSLLAAAVCVMALVGINRASFLFPNVKAHASNPQKPKVVPLSKVPDRPLFTVKSASAGPWRLGVLDTYSGDSWLLPGYDPSRLVTLKPSGQVPGAVSGESTPATFTLQQLGGFDLPAPPDPQRVTGARGSVDYDPRTQTLRASGGAPPDGYRYTVEAETTPTGPQLEEAATQPVPTSLSQYLAAPPAPVSILDLLHNAPTNKWERLQLLRTKLYDNVVAAGPGLPSDVPPAMVVAMMNGGKANPYEIVAGEALLARWVGLPSRIGYGFYGGEPYSGGALEFRPRDGANWLEVNLPGLGWVPILGTPLHAQSSLGSKTRHQPHILPSDQIAMQIYVPVLNQNPELLFEEFRYWLFRLVPLAVALFILRSLIPAGARALRRRRRDRWAAQFGPAGRIAVAYCEFRDCARDLGLDDGNATPIEFLAGVTDDLEHSELAWLTTRALWGDLSRDLGPGDARAAQALSRSLRRRLAQAQPGFVRVSAVMSRASLKSPWDAGLPNAWPSPHPGRPSSSGWVRRAVRFPARIWKTAVARRRVAGARS